MLTAGGAVGLPDVAGLFGSWKTADGKDLSHAVLDAVASDAARRTTPDTTQHRAENHPMNPLGAQAMRHYQQFLPDRWAAIPEAGREAFFEELGREAADRIAELTQAYAGPDQPGEGYLGKLGRLTVARAQATEVVNAELVLPAPPEAQDPGLVATAENSDQPPPFEWDTTDALEDQTDQ